METLLVFLVLVGLADCCGVSTHIEIGYRAQDGFRSASPNADFGKLLLKHPDALEAGSPYPDSYYDPICFGNKYHSVSEDTHWTPFTNASINYIRQRYPPPWDEATEKLVVFLMGIVSHQTADISWHSLDIEQGFLRAMAAVNYHGSFEAAHGDGDIGGDVMSMFGFNMSHIPYFTEWYIPVDDLYNIYTELYGASLMPKSVIIACTTEMFAERLGEKLAIDKLYWHYAERSPFLLGQFTDYFLGGVDDMAVWTQNNWRNVIFMLDNGTEACSLPYNPLFIHCKGEKTTPLKKKKSDGKPERHGFYRKRQFTEVGRKDIVVKERLRGVSLQPDHHIQKALLMKEKERAEVMEKRKMKARHGQSKEKAPDAVYSINDTYAKLGWSMTSGDLDGDGNEDIVIGAPGYRFKDSPQDGAVFVVFGSDKGLPTSALNMAESADVVLHGMPSVNGRLGSSVAIVDINQDGIPDIATGAPSTGSSQLSYTGAVEVFYGVGHRQFVRNMSVTCQEYYCNLGRSLASADINGDGFPDLLIGSPFAGGKGDQRGMVTAVLSSKTYRDTFVHLKVSALPWKAYGSQNYSWFGESIFVAPNPLQDKASFILVTEPTWRRCVLPNCSFSANDTQEIGQLNVLTVSTGKPLSPALQMRGTQKFQRFGSSATVGRPLPDGTPVLAVGAPGQDVDGSVLGIDMTFPQTGAVMLYNLSNPKQAPLAIFSGDRRSGGFGSQIKFFDINNDGYDDLIIGAPLRTEDVTQLIHAGEQGAAYIYYGGPSFPLGSKATSRCPTFSEVKPCPADTASVVLTFGENKARFGAQFAVVRSKTKVEVVVTALHSSQGARLSGAVAVYSFPKN